MRAPGLRHQYHHCYVRVIVYGHLTTLSRKWSIAVRFTASSCLVWILVSAHLIRFQIRLIGGSSTRLCRYPFDPSRPLAYGLVPARRSDRAQGLCLFVDNWLAGSTCTFLMQIQLANGRPFACAQLAWALPNIVTTLMWRRA